MIDINDAHCQCKWNNNNDQIDYHAVNHKATRKANSNVSNAYDHDVSLSSHSFAVSPLGPVLEGGGVVVTYW